MSRNRLWSACCALVPVLGCLAFVSTLAACDSGTSSTDDEGQAPSTVLPSMFGSPTQSGSGTTAEQYLKSDVQRDGINYFFMANGWGPGFQSQTVTWNGTYFSVDSMQGTRGDNYEPATYPTVFCGVYSDSRSKECGLPKAIDSIQTLRTGWRWSANGNTTSYNAAYDIWLSNTEDIRGHSAFLMVWLRDPQGAQPAGSRKFSAVQVNNAPGDWNVWVGVVGGKPCISYVRAEGYDSPAAEFDVMDFVRDARARQISLPGSIVLSVAVGFEIWSGPITKLESNDFYVQVK